MKDLLQIAIKHLLKVAGCIGIIAASIMVGSLIALVLFPNDIRRLVGTSDCIASALVLTAVATSLRFFQICSTIQMILALVAFELFLVSVVIFQTGYSVRDVLDNSIARDFVWNWIVDIQGFYLLGSWLYGVSFGGFLASPRFRRWRTSS